MKKSINNLIILLSIILILPISLEWLFKYEIPDELIVNGISIDSWQVLKLLSGIVICYVIYVNVNEYIEQRKTVNK